MRHEVVVAGDLRPRRCLDTIDGGIDQPFDTQYIPRIGRGCSGLWCVRIFSRGHILQYRCANSGAHFFSIGADLYDMRYRVVGGMAQVLADLLQRRIVLYQGQDFTDSSIFVVSYVLEKVVQQLAVGLELRKPSLR